MTIPERPWEAPEPEPKKSLTLLGIPFGYWAAVVLFAGLVWACSGQESETRKGGPGSSELACKEKVRAQLRTPSTAKFSGISSSNEGNGKWYVAGTVSASNALGGTVDHRFSCDLRWISGENYSGTANVSAY